MLLILSVCENLALITQEITRVRRTILSPLACLTLTYCSGSSYKRHDFRGRGVSQLLTERRVLILSKQFGLK
jgi:hypothetical protein